MIASRPDADKQDNGEFFWWDAAMLVENVRRSQESGPQVSASPGPCQPRRERSASPVRPIGPALADLHRARPGKAQTAQDPQPPKPRGTAGGPRDARVSFGQLRIVRYQPFCIQSPHGRARASGSSFPPSEPPEISSPGLAAISGMAPPVRLPE
ncbi:uncharacterized protein K444DRAFT_635833 [Hyaloscypha bicolor E]|uniref:Uncharacterized protein n=1 Tax=Hyaloscypha bicolor E TaxID=1095630 RepID=A0A2J6SQ68_9HELO|nr:uncharacterized protein K444DRAFT_635833 [Hyaloscypha bicolor E]PMD52901.1 hypothetical protein K444DRAFT_635833 [Hyaloscypha bicolor E]